MEHTVSVDVTESQIEQLKLGQKVKIEMVGEVIELAAEHKVEYGPDDTTTYPASLRMEVASTKVSVSPNKFTELANDDDNDEDN